jgi:hypothetical protein
MIRNDRIENGVVVSADIIDVNTNTISEEVNGVIVSTRALTVEEQERYAKQLLKLSGPYGDEKLSSSTTGDLLVYDGTSWSNAPDISGNAGSASALQTARNIGGVSFDGTSDISLPGVDAAGTQDTSGNAATSSTLAQARTINDVSFDGSASIKIDGISAGAALEDGASTSTLGLPGVDIFSIGSIGLGAGVTQLYGPIFVDQVVTITDCAVEIITAWTGGTVSLHMVQADSEWQPIVGTDVTLTSSVDCSTTGVKATTGLSIDLSRGRWLTVVKETVEGNGVIRSFSGAPPGVSFFSDSFSSTDASGFWRKIAPTAVTDKWSRSKYASTDRGFQQPMLMKWVRSFEPTDIGAILWLDAADTTTITESGGAVSQWDNKGTLGNFTQPTASGQPTTGATSLNGKNVVDFVDDVLTSVDSNSVWNVLHNGTEYVVAAVVKFGNVADPDDLYGLMGTGYIQANHGMYIAYDDRVSASRNDALIDYVANGTGTQPVNNITGDGVVPANTFSVLSVFVDPNNGVVAERSEIYVDNGEAIANNTASGSPSTADATYPLQIGSVGFNQNLLTGSLAEIVVVAGANATEVNRNKLHTYLAAKWGIDISPPFSPLELSPVLWLDASDATTITESGGSVSQWDDKSGNLNNVSQATASYQPKTGTATMNGLNALEFDTPGGLQHLANATFPFIGTDYDIFMTLRVDRNNTSFTLFSSANKNGVAGIALQGSTSIALQANMPYSEIYIDGALFTDTQRGQLYDATATNSTIVVHGTDVTATLYDGISISRHATDPGFGDGTVVGEVIVVPSSTMSPALVAETEQYLIDKWVFSPLNLQPALWYDASDTSTITELSGSVSQWDDKSGNGYHLTQLTGIYQPTTGVRTLNGRNVLGFDGADDRMITGAFASNLTQPNTIFAVFIPEKTTAYYVYDGRDGSNRHALVPNTSASLFAGNSLGLENADTVPQVARAVFDGTSSSLYIDGVLKRTGDVGTHSLGGLTVGSRYSYQSFFKGAIAEIIVCDGLLSQQEITVTEDYLTRKWGTGFSPLDLSPTLWLDASDETTITESGGSVSQWDDKSGNGYNLQQGTGANQPATGTRTLNGLNVLDFDGTSDYLAASLAASAGLFTVFAVFEQDASSNDAVLTLAPASGDDWNNTAGATLTTGNPASNMIAEITHRYISLADQAFITGTPPSPAGVYVAVVDNTALTVSSGSNTDSGTSFGGSASSNQVLISARFLSSAVRADLGLNGAIAEVILVENTLTAQQISDAEAYLANKWGITL